MLSFGSTKASQTSIKAQAFTAAGVKVGPEFLVNTTTAEHQYQPDVAALPDGRFVVTWTDNSTQATTGLDIRSQIFDPRTAGTTFVGTAAGEQFGGTSGVDDLSGAGGNDFIYASGGADDLDGGSGNDLLDGGAGADDLVGGSGTDTASYANSAAAVDVDMTALTATGGDAQGDTLAGIENLTGSRFADRLHGTSANNVIIGGDGNDVMNGRGGDDTLYGGLGADRLDGSDGRDRASYGYASAGVIVDLTTGTGTGGEATGDRLFRIENLSGSAFADRLTGNTAANHINGGRGNDVIFGLVGHDTLDGGNDNDLIEGGVGRDTIIGGYGTDTASYRASSAGVNVNLATGTGAGGDASGDTLSAIENLTGSAFGDVLVGDAGNNVLTGLAGADRLDGGLGIDTVSYQDAGAAIKASLSSRTGTLGEAAGDVLRGIENLTGSAFDDILVGDTSNNVLTGGAGADEMNGSGGVDTANYATSTSGVTVSLNSGTGIGGDAQGDRLFWIENVTGSRFADVLTGSDGDNVISDGSGNDTINARAGNDTVIAGSGTDVYHGGDGIDTLSYANATSGLTLSLGTTSQQGGAPGGPITISGFENVIGTSFDDEVDGTSGNNVLIGGAGDDQLSSGNGTDRLAGGTGDDTYVGGAFGETTFAFGVDSGVDLVMNFATKNALPAGTPHDILEFDTRVFDSFADVMASTTENEFGTEIRIDADQYILLLGVSKASLTADDFTFVDPGDTVV